MKVKQSNHWAKIFHWRDFRLQVFVEGIIVGLFAGIVSVAFRYLLEKADWLRNRLYVVISSGGFKVAFGWFIALIIISLIISMLVKFEPMSKGSGIPDVEGILARHFKMNWLRVLVAKFIGGVLAIGAGLSLGREGPSVQLGAAVGQGISRIFGRSKIEEKYLLTSGASAGLAAAFNAPLAGVIFALEELHKNFSPAVLMSAVAASLTADLVTQEVFGPNPVFNFQELSVFPIRYYFYLIILGAICGAFGTVFNKTLLRSLDVFDKISSRFTFLGPAVALIISGLLGLVLPQALGGGNNLIDAMTKGKFALSLLLVLLVIKFLFTMISYGSGVPGGIFLPLLVIGALTGNIYGHFLINFLHVDNQYAINFIVLAMSAYFTAIVKAPITGSILITEMTGSFHHLLALITVSMVAYVISDLLNGKPVYEQLLHRSLSKRGFVTAKDDKGNKIITEVAVCLGSKLDGKRIKDVQWPEHCLLISIKRGATDIIPKGNTSLRSGDYLFVLVNENQANKIKEELLKMAAECEPRGYNET
ncbi:MAG TPA: H(+)/Cl(-) exchange transporter ClcA [Candidatus Deferrimicrobium sp.]|nr:H(+)/Cl(-) exchange transporter ClcA [Candidatus Deferrimicrobium sp.]